ncbi:hypothetical protein B0H11DRAFT_1789892 [Mycena galericulata]|nr:hypothetical protein B0H11DRAFT_1789892 [Mycena galericulata]
MSLHSNDKLFEPIHSPLSNTLLQGSHRLSAADIRIAAQIIAQGERRIIDLQAAINSATVQVDLDRLADERDRVHQQIVQHQNSIRAFRRLPPEIISKIFTSTIPHTDPDEPGSTPWYLGHICQYFRDVAIGVPSLWWDIIIISSARYPVEQLETLLSRSANAPLRVSFWSSSAGNARLLQMLVECSPRWTAATLVVTPGMFIHLAGVRGRIPQLRYLRIDVINYWYPRSVSTEQSDPFEIAPALRDVAFEDVSGLPHSLVLPFAQLTRLKATLTHWRYIATLNRTPNVEAASIDIEGDSPKIPGPLVSLPFLRRLYISSLSFLNELTLPVLEELYMVDSSPEPLLSLLTRCPSIRLKTLRIMWCEPRNITAILAAASTVQTFAVQITSHNKADELVLGLTVRAQGCIGPNIDSIILSLDGGKIHLGQLVKMIESRWRVPPQGGPCRRLRSLELLMLQETEDDGKMGSALTQRLQRLENEGLCVSVLYGIDAHHRLLDWRV